MRIFIGHSRGISQRGDTLVEVAIAVAILGIVVAGTMSVMNRMFVSILNSAERTAVRAEMNGQAELLYYIKANSKTTTKNAWIAIRNSARTAIAGNITDLCTATSGKSFYINATTNINSVAPVFVTTNTNRNTLGRATIPNSGGVSSGIVIDAVYYNGGPSMTAYIDFYIKACWDSLGSMPVSQSSTIVRIYDTM